MNEESIRHIVESTIDELMRQGVLNGNPNKKYLTMSKRLHAYYGDGEKDDRIREAIRKVEFDQYFRIIPLYYSCQYTNEQIAERLGVDVSTVTRNKKRIVCEIANHY